MNNMEQIKSEIVKAVEEKSLAYAFLIYAGYFNAPKEKHRTNGYNIYTPKGHMTVKNNNFKSEIVEWKREKLFPYFLELGFSKKELAEAWKESFWRKKTPKFANWNR
jgi:hypothetical protein